MSRNYNTCHLELDRELLKQKSITRYIRLKKLNQSELNLDDQLFVENFETGLHLWVL